MQSFTTEQLFAHCVSLAKQTPTNSDRIARAQLLVLNDSVRHAGALEYFVAASDGNGSYVVTIGAQPCCSCADFANRGAECKHLLAANIYRTLTTPRARLGVAK